MLVEEEREEPLDAELSKLTALPVQFSPDKFRDRCKGKAKKIPELDYGSPLATRLEHMQPFHDSQVDEDASLPENDSVVSFFATPVDGDGNPVPEHHPVASLAAWSNEDKHRRLTVAMARNAFAGVIPDFAFDSAPPEHEWHSGQEIVAAGPVVPPEGTRLVADMYPYIAVQRPETLVWSPLAAENKRYQKYVTEVGLPFLLTGDTSAGPLPSDLEIGTSLPREELLASRASGYYFNSPAEAEAQSRALFEADNQINFIES